MPQRNIHRSLAATRRFATAGDVLPVLGMSLFALLALVLLITHGGAG